MICERGTDKHPSGRTGTSAGYQAHLKAGEVPCLACREAHLAKGRTRWAELPPEERAERSKLNRAETERYRRNSPEKAQASTRRHLAKRRQLIRDAKARPCADCGIQYPHYVMQFDHLGDKEFTISARTNTVSIARLLAEIAKCDVVCANCHAERSYHRMIQRREAS